MMARSQRRGAVGGELGRAEPDRCRELGDGRDARALVERAVARRAEQRREVAARRPAEGADAGGVDAEAPRPARARAATPRRARRRRSPPGTGRRARAGSSRMPRRSPRSRATGTRCASPRSPCRRAPSCRRGSTRRPGRARRRGGSGAGLHTSRVSRVPSSRVPYSRSSCDVEAGRGRERADADDLGARDLARGIRARRVDLAQLRVEAGERDHADDGRDGGQRGEGDPPGAEAGAACDSGRGHTGLRVQGWSDANSAAAPMCKVGRSRASGRVAVGRCEPGDRLREAHRVELADVLAELRRSRGSRAVV